VVLREPKVEPETKAGCRQNTTMIRNPKGGDRPTSSSEERIVKLSIVPGAYFGGPQECEGLVSSF
jgi:hypothetical protein